MATRKKRTRKPKVKEIVQIVSTTENLYALTDDGGVYLHVDDTRTGFYGWDELPSITEENILNLNDGDEDDGEDE